MDAAAISESTEGMDGLICTSYRHLRHEVGNIAIFRASTIGLANTEWKLVQYSLRWKYGSDRCQKHTTFDSSVLPIATIVVPWLSLWALSGVDLMWCLLAGRMWRCRGAAGELPRWRKIHRLLARGLACTTTRAKSGDDGEWDLLFR